MTATALDALLTEQAWQDQLVHLFRLHGWWHFHDRVAWRSDAGYPDLTLIHPGQRRAVWIEVKAQSGTLSSRQRDWIAALEAAGQEVFCLKPADWALAERIARGEA